MGFDEHLGEAGLAGLVEHVDGLGEKGALVPVDEDAAVRLLALVLEQALGELIEGDESSWEGAPLTKLAKMGEMMAFEHNGFWQPMDTLREKHDLERMSRMSVVPWKEIN